MRHAFAIASRELRAFFVSPVAYVVLTLWSVLAGTFFLSSLLSFQDEVVRSQQLQALDHLAGMNLNDALITPFIGSMWVALLFLLPAVTMGLFANERVQGTEELLLTSPISIGEIVLGKFLAGCGFALLMTAVVSVYPGALFVYGDPELGKTAAGLLGLLLVTITYVSVGAFASSLTRNPLIAFVSALVLLLVLGVMLPFLVEIGLGDATDPASRVVAGLMHWVGTGSHFETLLAGIVDSADLAYFAIVTGSFLLLTRAVVESIRWRS